MALNQVAFSAAQLTCLSDLTDSNFPTRIDSRHQPDPLDVATSAAIPLECRHPNMAKLGLFVTGRKPGVAAP